MLRAACVLLPLVGALVGGCKGANTSGDKKADIDADPLALLPSSAVIVANVDARTIFTSRTVGGQAAAVAKVLAPLGPEAGLDPSRDIDRIVAAGFGVGDVAVVVSGRFDEAKIAAASTGKNGVPVVRGVYADHTTYTSGPIAYTVLTGKTVVAGTGDGLRRVLDRVHDGTLDRAIPPWMVETLATPGAEVALAADFGTQPIAAATLGALNLPWVKGMRIARVIGNFEDPGMNVASTLTYDGSVQAESAAEGIRAVDSWLTVLGPFTGGLRLQNLDVSTQASNPGVSTSTVDVHCKFSIDGRTFLQLLSLGSRVLEASR